MFKLTMLFMGLSLLGLGLLGTLGVDGVSRELAYTPGPGSCHGDGDEAGEGYGYWVAGSCGEEAGECHGEHEECGEECLEEGTDCDEGGDCDGHGGEEG